MWRPWLRREGALGAALAPRGTQEAVRPRTVARWWAPQWVLEGVQVSVRVSVPALRLGLGLGLGLALALALALALQVLVQV